MVFREEWEELAAPKVWRADTEEPVSMFAGLFSMIGVYRINGQSARAGSMGKGETSKRVGARSEMSHVKSLGVRAGGAFLYIRVVNGGVIDMCELRVFSTRKRDSRL